MGRNRAQFNIRLPPELITWLSQYCGRTEHNKTEVIEALLGQLRQGRISLPSGTTNAFPAEVTHQVGDTPEDPIFFACGGIDE